MENFNLAEEESKAINGNNLLLSLEGFIKYIEGLNKGIQAAASVNPQIVTDCIGEVLEYLVTAKNQFKTVLLACEEVLTENENLKEKLQQQSVTIEKLEQENTELDVQIAKLEAKLTEG